MKGDISMLQQYSQVWYERFTGAIQMAPTGLDWITFLHQNATERADTAKPFTKTYKEIEPLVPSDIPLSAIDFHCSNIVILAFAQFLIILKQFFFMFIYSWRRLKIVFGTLHLNLNLAYSASKTSSSLTT